jgi:opacity protein-like surface antigen
MKAKPTCIVALSVASAAALLLSVGASLADGLPARAPAAYTPPTSWTGLYIGFESGWDWDRTDFRGTEGAFKTFGPRASWDRDVINAGLYGGYQQQIGQLVLGVEFNLIGNQFDNADTHRDVAAQTPTTGNCPNREFNCVGRITDEFTVGGRLGWAAGNWMPYATGGWATGSINFRAIPTSGVAAEWADGRAYGWYAGGGLEYKLSSYAVVGIEYRHVDLGDVTEESFSGSTPPTLFGPVRMTAESDMILLRGALLFDPRPAYAPMK